MSRAQRAAAALNDDIKGLFSEEDRSALEEVALDYFTGHSRAQASDSEDSASDSEDSSEDDSFSISRGRAKSTSNISTVITIITVITITATLKFVVLFL